MNVYKQLINTIRHFFPGNNYRQLIYPLSKIFKLAKMRRDILKFTEDSRSEGISSDAYGINGSFHITDLEQEFQKRLVVRNKYKSICFSI